MINNMNNSTGQTDKKLDLELSGYIKVQTDKNLSHMVKIEPA